MKRYLICLLGFKKSHITILRRKLNESGIGTRVRVIGRPYKNYINTSKLRYKKEDYNFLAENLYDLLFEKSGRSLFCANDSSVCALSFPDRKKSCKNNVENKCRFHRPEVIMLFYFKSKGYNIGNRFGRFSMQIELDEKLYFGDETVGNFCIDIINRVEGSDISKCIKKIGYRKYFLLPIRNFYSTIRDEYYSNMNTFEILIKYINSMRHIFSTKGEKIIDEERFEFRLDKPHRVPDPDVGKIDWISAHYRFGIDYDFKTHYDVTNKDNKPISNKLMYDIKSGNKIMFSARYLNIFPNDNIQN